MLLPQNGLTELKVRYSCLSHYSIPKSFRALFALEHQFLGQNGKYKFKIITIKRHRHQMNRLTKQKETHRLRERTYDCQGGRVVGSSSQGIQDGRVHTAVFKMDNQKDLLYSTGNSARRYAAALMGGEFGEEWIHVLCVAESLCCPPDTITTLFTDYIPI